MQIIRGLWNSKRWEKPELSAMILLFICFGVHGSTFLTLWESPCKQPHRKQPMDKVIKTLIDFIQKGNLANLYHQRLSKLNFNVCEWGQVSSIKEGKNEKEDITSQCKWTKHLRRKISGEFLSFYKGLSVYAVLLQHMENNERLWIHNLTLHSEDSVLDKIHELQNDFVTIGCIIESITGNKPTADVNKLFDSINLSTDLAYGSSEGNYAVKRLEQFLEISHKKFKNKNKKRGQTREGAKSQRKEKTKRHRKSENKRKEIV